MRTALLKVYVKSHILWEALKEEKGQDLIEYALVCALIALAATAGMGTLADGINKAFGTVSNKLNNSVS